MNPEQNIEQKVGRDPGFKVPEGYFEEFYASMPQRLPERKAVPAVPMSRWQRIKPYVYLAAMFMGIWCMMKMFHMMTNPDISLDTPPDAVVAMLDEEPITFEEMTPDYSLGDYELEEEVAGEYTDIDQLTEDLDLNLKPQYQSMNVEPIVEAVLQPEVAVTSEPVSNNKQN